MFGAGATPMNDKVQQEAHKQASQFVSNLMSGSNMQNIAAAVAANMFPKQEASQPEAKQTNTENSPADEPRSPVSQDEQQNDVPVQTPVPKVYPVSINILKIFMINIIKNLFKIQISNTVQ